MATPKWLRQYEAHGVDVLSEKDRRWLQMVGIKYDTDIPRFYEAVSQMYSPKASIQKALKEGSSEARKISSLAKGLALGEASSKDIEELLELIDLSRDTVDYFKEKATTTKALQKRFDLVREDFGIDFKTLDMATKNVTTNVKKLGRGRRGIGKDLAESSLAESAASTVKDAALAALGPVGGIASMMGSTAVKVGRGIRDRHIAAKDRAAIGAFKPASETEIQEFNQLADKYKDSGDVNKIFSSGSVQGGYSSVSPDDLGRKRRPYKRRKKSQIDDEPYVSSQGVGGMHNFTPSDEFFGGMKDTLYDAVFAFFDDGAYKAKWTRDLLRGEFKGESTDKKKSTGKLTATLGKLLPALGVIASFAGGAAIGTALRKAFPQIDESLSGEKGVITKAMIKWDNTSEELKDTVKKSLIAGPAALGQQFVQSDVGKKLATTNPVSMGAEVAKKASIKDLAMAGPMGMVGKAIQRVLKPRDTVKDVTSVEREKKTTEVLRKIDSKMERDVVVKEPSPVITPATTSPATMTTPSGKVKKVPVRQTRITKVTTDDNQEVVKLLKELVAKVSTAGVAGTSVQVPQTVNKKYGISDRLMELLASGNVKAGV